MKKYNNKSQYFKDWTTKKLKEEAISYDQTINIVGCYGVRDMIAFNGIMTELSCRGVEPKTELIF